MDIFSILSVAPCYLRDMKAFILMSLCFVSFNSYALRFTIEKRVKNGYVIETQSATHSRSGRRMRQGVRTARPLYISDQTFRYLSFQLNKIKKKLPVDFNKIRQLKIVPAKINQDDATRPITGRYHSRSNTIEINYKYLFKGYEQNLLRALVHEISHAYEEEVAHVSFKEKFLYLAGWHKRGVVFKWKSRRNFLNYRSPDPYEFTNTAEAFAVNMEYFLLDPKYQCRRPLLNNYLSIELLEIPFWDEDGTACTPMLDFPVQMGDRVGWWKLDPKKLYEVHYLLADKGSAAESSFGHSMLRLVMCAPSRKEVSRECVKDIEHHMVLSYRANITDTIMSYWKGITGGYDSQLFIYPMVSIIKEYTRDEFRNLISVPLRLRVFERQDFIRKMQEEVWAYRGRYRFITQNCATETLDFFKPIIDRMSFRTQYSLTPYGVLDILHKFGMTYLPAVNSNNERWKVENTFLIKSEKQSYINYFNKIKRFTRYDEFDEYIKEASIQERMRVIDELERHNVKTDVYSGMFLLEKYINILRNKKLQSDIIKYTVSDDGPQELKQLVARKQDFLKNQFPKEKLGYGIPLPEEFEQLKNFVKSKNDVVSVDPQTVFRIVNRRFSSQIDEWQKGKENEKRLQALVLTGDQ